jgi:IstB-like ATP binding protein
MGMKHLPKRSGEYLFEIIMRRYETRSTIMTSNRPLEDWGKLIGDVPSATAILDRFLHHAEIIRITGRSYRLRQQTGKPGEQVTTMTVEAAKDDSLEVDRTAPKPANAPSGSKPSKTRSKPANAPPGSEIHPDESKPANAPPGSEVA